ncbi:MAG: O-antigen ligase family protein [Chitinophagaceae bacterium]
MREVFEIEKSFIQNKSQSSLQRLINIFVFFLAFPCINILGNSITFYIFIILIIREGLFWQKPYRAKALLFSFMLICFLSTLFAPYDKMETPPGFFPKMQLVIQFVYWMLLASFFIIYKKVLDWVQISKASLFGFLAATMGFYFLKIEVGNALGEFSTDITRNAFVFNVLATTPVSCIYVLKKFKMKGIYALLIASIASMFFSLGRSGSIIILLESFLILSIFSRVWNNVIRFSIIPVIVVFILSESSFVQPALQVLADKTESINPRFANLIRGEQDGDLTMDKSWLLRKLMITKSFEVIKEYPLLGVGVKNFVYYESDLDQLYSRFDRLAYRGKDYLNSRSSHNSYILVMSEMGLLGFAILIALLLIPLVKISKILLFGDQIKMSQLPLIGLLGISMHFYAIASIYGAVTWFIIGISIAASIDD